MVFQRGPLLFYGFVALIAFYGHSVIDIGRYKPRIFETYSIALNGVSLIGSHPPLSPSNFYSKGSLIGNFLSCCYSLPRRRCGVLLGYSHLHWLQRCGHQGLLERQRVVDFGSYGHESRCRLVRRFLRICKWPCLIHPFCSSNPDVGHFNVLLLVLGTTPHCLPWICWCDCKQHCLIDSRSRSLRQSHVVLRLQIHFCTHPNRVGHCFQDPLVRLDRLEFDSLPHLPHGGTSYLYLSSSTNDC